jgi:hypothetical protein
MLFQVKGQAGYVSDLIDFASEREKEALVNGALRTGNHSIYFSEANVDSILAEGAAVLASVKEEIIPEEIIPEPILEDAYNPDGTYKHKGRKEGYTKLDKTVGEGDKVKLMFAAMNLGKLKRNFAFIKNEDPLFPNNRRISLPDIYGTGSSNYWVNPAFWAFVLEEYTRHLTKRIVEDEERSNCYKKGAHKRWRECDFKSERVNGVRLPPKGDFNKAPLWDD